MREQVQTIIIGGGQAGPATNHLAIPCSTWRRRDIALEAMAGQSGLPVALRSQSPAGSKFSR